LSRFYSKIQFFRRRDDREDYGLYHGILRVQDCRKVDTVRRCYATRTPELEIELEFELEFEIEILDLFYDRLYKLDKLDKLDKLERTMNTKLKLKYAFDQNDMPLAKSIMNSGMNIDTRFDHKKTLLHMAVERGSTEWITLLLIYGADIDAQDSYGHTPLHLSVTLRKTDCLRLLLEKGADFSTYDNLGHTPFSDAVTGKFWDHLRILVEYKAESVEDMKLLSLQACDNNDIELMCELLSNGIFDFNTRTKKGTTPLIFIAQRGCVQSMRLITEHKVELDAQDNHGDTAVHWAAYNNRIECLRLLLERGADPNLPNSKGHTPLHTAINRRNLDCMIALLENGADLNLPNSYGDTPLHTATNKYWLDCMFALLSKGADPNLPNSYGDTPLHIAARAGRHDLLFCLLENGARHDLMNRSKLTPLHCAVLKGSHVCLRLLLERGADPTIPDENGDLLILFASSKECIRLLLKYYRPIQRREEKETYGAFSDSQKLITNIYIIPNLLSSLAESDVEVLQTRLVGECTEYFMELCFRKRQRESEEKSLCCVCQWSDGDDRITLSCGHTIHTECMHAGIRTYLSLESFEDATRCVECRQTYTPTELAVGMNHSPELLTSFQRLAARHLGYKFCARCDSTIVKYNSDRGFEGYCNICHLNLCFNCGKLPHCGSTCEEILTDKGSMRQLVNELLQKNAPERYGFCPKCHKLIEKNDGCSSMVCGKDHDKDQSTEKGCGLRFDWTVRVPVTEYEKFYE